MWSFSSVDFHTLTLQLPIQTPNSVAPELQAFVSSLAISAKQAHPGGANKIKKKFKLFPFVKAFVGSRRGKILFPLLSLLLSMVVSEFPFLKGVPTICLGEVGPTRDFPQIFHETFNLHPPPQYRKKHTRSHIKRTIFDKTTKIVVWIFSALFFFARSPLLEWRAVEGAA